MECKSLIDLETFCMNLTSGKTQTIKFAFSALPQTPVRMRQDSSSLSMGLKMKVGCLFDGKMG